MQVASKKKKRGGLQIRHGRSSPTGSTLSMNSTLSATSVNSMADIDMAYGSAMFHNG